MPQLPELLKSRRFWSAVIGLAMLVIVNLVPELAARQEELSAAIVIIVGMLIGGYSLEDTATALRGEPPAAKPRPSGD